MSEEKKQSSKSEFELIPREAEKFIFLAECAKLQSQGNLWTKNQEIVAPTHAIQLSPVARTLTLAAAPQIPDSKWQEALASKAELFVNLTHASANLFFKSALTAAAGNTLLMPVPEKLYRVQRRHSFRLQMKGSYSLMVDFQHPTQPEDHLSKRVLDLSDTGMAFLISAQEEPLFRAGTILTAFHFVLNKQSVIMEAEVRYAKPFSKEAKEYFKVGVKFKNASQEDSWFIASYVLAESRRMMSNSI